MTTNIKIAFWAEPYLKLEDGPEAGNSILKIEKRGNLAFWDNDRNAKGTSLPVSADAAENIVDFASIKGVEITGPTDTLQALKNLLILKARLKDLEVPHFQLTINKSLSNQSHHWSFANDPDTDRPILKLETADFGNDLGQVSINDAEYEDDGIKASDDYSTEKQELLDLASLLKRIASKYRKIQDDNGPDFDLPDPSIELGKPEKNVDGEVRAAYGLRAYPAAPPLAIKNTLYNLLEDKIKTEIEDLKMLKSIIKYVLLTDNDKKKSRLIILDHNGFRGTEEEIDEIKKQPGHYKGFSVLDPNLEAVLNVDNKFEVRKKDPNKPVRYTKENIDNFRTPIPAYTGDYHDLLTKTRIIQDRKGNDIEVFANSDPRDCLGFQPGDLELTNFKGKQRKMSKNSAWIIAGKSKIYYDILSAQNAEEAMDLAFFGKDYEEPLSDNPVRKGNPKDADSVKTPSPNLRFDEVRDWTRLQTLNHYHQALRAGSVEWRIPATDSEPAKNAPKYVDDNPAGLAVKQEIDNNYQLAKKWIEDYERWIGLGGEFASLNETDLNTAKTELESWKGKQIYTSGGVWKKVIDDFLVEIDAALHHLGFEAELAGLKNRGSVLAQNIYKDLKANENDFTPEVFAELKKLIGLLEEAFGTKKDSTESELNAFVASGEANKQKAVEIAKKAKNQDSDTEDCVETALKKLKTPSENKLEEAREKLKSLLTDRKTGGKDAYQEVVADIQNSETDLNRASQIFEKLKEIEEANQDDSGALLTALNNLKNDTNNTKAWNALNKYKRDGQSQGFAEEMLKKLNDLAQKRKKSHEVLKKAQTKAEFQAAKTEFMKKPEYRTEKPDYDEIYFPLLNKAADIREKGTQASSEEKELTELMTVILTDYNDWKTQLADLEGKLNKLKDYGEGGAKNNVIQSYSDIEKTALKKLINKMEVKVQEFQKAKSNSENKNNSSPTPWYRTTIGIIGIIFVSVAIIAAAVYYFWFQKAETEENQE